MTHQKKSLLSAIVIFIALVLWMLSGRLGNHDQGTAHANTPTGDESILSELPLSEDESPINGDVSAISVVVENSYAHWIQPTVEIYARTEPLQEASISSLLGGIIESVSMQAGQLVSEGDPLVIVSLGTKPSRLSEAQAWLKKRSADVAAASKMKSEGYQSEAEYQGIVAALEAAKHELAQIELEIWLSTVRAPFNGVVEKRNAEPGSVINSGQVLGQLVRQDQYLLVANLPESQVHLFTIGQTATARLTTGKTVDGTVRYIATQADDKTRSYRLEVLIDNDHPRFVGGASAKLLLERNQVQVHRVSSNVVTLDEEGVLGVKTVGIDHRVEFWPVDISQAERQMLLVQGMPEATQVIVSGQGFVRAGDLVKISPAQPAKSAAESL
ncbi:MAG: multidrug efflux system membrane fusion protein [Gammaproteobacteria bacterium]|jgi:multidrug efflux system membrane fusion protein